MHLNSLTILQFKNYTKLKMAFGKQVVCFTGHNGAGKTNLLDAIYYCCMGKSYFHSTDQHNIQHGLDFFRLDVVINLDNEELKLKCVYQTGKRKELELNELAYDRLSDHVGRFPVVIVTPDDNILINGPSDERRRFLDITASQIDHSYLNALQAYTRILTQRNALLKKALETGRLDKSMLQVYDDELALHAELIHQKRQAFVTELTPDFNSVYAAISGDREQVGLEYSSPLNERTLSEILKQNFERDRAMGRTSSGTHRDDLELMMDGHTVRRFGSQGQQKSFLIALKLAQYQLLYRHKGIKPFLLLDDIFDKLDAGRSARLLHHISDTSFGQIFITDTQRARIEGIFTSHPSPPEIFEVEGGVLV